MPRETAQLLFFASRDPSRNRRGDGVYIRAHARAARALGLRPWILCPGSAPGLQATDFGTIETVRPTGWRIVERLRPSASIAAGLGAPALIEAALRRVAPGEPVVMHGFGVVSCAAVLAAPRLRKAGRAVTVFASCYTCLEHEFEVKLAAMTEPAHGWRQRVRAHLEHRIVRHAVTRREAIAYVGSDRVLLNYRALEKQVLGLWPGARTLRLPYASERAFDVDGNGDSPGDPPHLDAGVTNQGGDRHRPRRPVIAALAWHDPRKGWDVLLRALALLRRDGTEFDADLIGGGPLAAVHQRLARTLGLEGVVRFHTAASDEDVQRLLRRAAVFAHAARQEGSGSLAVIEAMALGLPVVASAVEGLVEDVTPGESGLLVPAGDAPALAAALRRLVEDPALRSRLGAGARAEHERRFAAGGLIAALDRLYRESGLETRPSGPPRRASPRPPG